MTKSKDQIIEDLQNELEELKKDKKIEDLKRDIDRLKNPFIDLPYYPDTTKLIYPRVIYNTSCY